MSTSLTRTIVTWFLFAFLIVVHSSGVAAHAQTSKVGTYSPDCSCESSVGLNWDSCGFLPFEGYEGWAHQRGELWCDGDVPSSFVEDHFTTANAAKKELKDILAGHPSYGEPLNILRVIEQGPAYLLELAEPVPVVASQDVRFGWVVKWVEDASVHSAYGCSSESALRLYQRQCASALPNAPVHSAAPN